MSTTLRTALTRRLPRSGDHGWFDLRYPDRWGTDAAIELWLTVGLVSVLDLVITFYGLRLGFFEVNPVARAGLVLFGFWSLVLIKAAAVSIGLFNYRMLGRYRNLVPTTYILIWGSAVLANTWLILVHGT